MTICLQQESECQVCGRKEGMAKVPSTEELQDIGKKIAIRVSQRLFLLSQMPGQETQVGLCPPQDSSQ